MNAKQLLSEYADACELIKETEKDIKKLESEKRIVVYDKVKGSMREFPYTEQNFSISGRPDETVIEKKIDSEYIVLEERKRKARVLGEAAATKLLLPMVLMLLVVMAVIMLPAGLSFYGG